MNVEIKKISKIINEMITFTMLGNAEKVNVSIENNEDMYKLLIIANNVNCSEKSVDNMRKLLNAPRQKAAEEYYWELTGDTDSPNDMALIGMMTDKSNVIYEDNDLLIELHRYK